MPRRTETARAPRVTVRRVRPDRVEVWEAFLQAEGGRQAVRQARASRARHDWLASEASWVLVALSGGQPAGAAVVVRVPKADARRGFLFVDELRVLPAYRRQGVATRLLAHIEQLARAQSLAGVRLLVRPENQAARRLYRRCGFSEYASRLCEKKVRA